MGAYERVVGALVGEEVRGPDGAAVRVRELTVEDLRVVVVHRQPGEGVIEGQVDDL